MRRSAGGPLNPRMPVGVSGGGGVVVPRLMSSRCARQEFAKGSPCVRHTLALLVVPSGRAVPGRSGSPCPRIPKPLEKAQKVGTGVPGTTFWYHPRSCFGDWCNGSTTDSESVCLGSNPRSPVSIVSLEFWGDARAHAPRAATHAIAHAEADITLPPCLQRASKSGTP